MVPGARHPDGSQVALPEALVASTGVGWTPLWVFLSAAISVTLVALSPRIIQVLHQMHLSWSESIVWMVYWLLCSVVVGVMAVCRHCLLQSPIFRELLDAACAHPDTRDATEAAARRYSLVLRCASLCWGCFGAGVWCVALRKGAHDWVVFPTYLAFFASCCMPGIVVVGHTCLLINQVCRSNIQLFLGVMAGAAGCGSAPPEGQEIDWVGVVREHRLLDGRLKRIWFRATFLFVPNLVLMTGLGALAAVSYLAHHTSHALAVLKLAGSFCGFFLCLLILWPAGQITKACQSRRTGDGSIIDVAESFSYEGVMSDSQRLKYQVFMQHLDRTPAGAELCTVLITPGMIMMLWYRLVYMCAVALPVVKVILYHKSDAGKGKAETITVGGDAQ